MTEPRAVEVNNLTYVYPNGKVSLQNINLRLDWGSRLIIIGPNGAGKSTLLKLLSGKTLCASNAIKLNGKDPFRLVSDNIATFLGTEWILNSVIKGDMPVRFLIASVGVNQLPQRRDKLVEILDIDLDWNMNQISDGQRRRVQLLLKLYTFWEVLLLDEVTVDLDVLVRLRLLRWLKHETEIRKCCVVYATHIFDGLASLGFPTHIVHLLSGKITRYLDYQKDIEFVTSIGNDEITTTSRNQNKRKDPSNETAFNNIEEYLASNDNHEIINDNAKRVKINNVHSIHPLALQWLTQDYKQANNNQQP